MKLTRLNILITALIVVSISSNIFTMWPRPAYDQSALHRYDFTDMFENSVLLFRPKGTERLSLINMDKAVITVTEYGPPLNCTLLEIQTLDGTIPGPCITGTISNE